MRLASPLLLFACAVFPRIVTAQQAVHPVHPLLEKVPAIIYTAAPVYDLRATLQGAERFPQGAELMILRGGHAAPFLSGFAASADANISFDGKTVLFSGKRNAADCWQIWIAPIDGAAPHRVARAPADLIRPLWLPAGRIVYARRTAQGFELESAALDGTAIQRLSFLAGNFIPDDVLRDGRILFESGFPLGSGKIPELYLIYSDGSGLESVRCDHEAADRQNGRQLQSGDIVFTHGSHLARFTSALAVQLPVAAPHGDYAGDISELNDGRWIVSVRPLAERHYQLQAHRPGTQGWTTVAHDSNRDLVQPVIIASRDVPNHHPSALHNWTTGNMLALDTRLSRSGNLKTAPASVRAETLSPDGQVLPLGIASIDSDGSFFVQAAGDRPLRFVLLDAQGKTLRQEHGWFWVRQGEQRICVGCHTGPERAPDNRVPQVLLRTTTPVALTGQPGGRAAGGH
jgi:hypothetical protein